MISHHKTIYPRSLVDWLELLVARTRTLLRQWLLHFLLGHYRQSFKFLPARYRTLRRRATLAIELSEDNVGAVERSVVLEQAIGQLLVVFLGVISEIRHLIHVFLRAEAG